jgi:hypothetical protein
LTAVATPACNATPTKASATANVAAGPSADALHPPRPADAGSGATSLVRSSVPNIGPATERNHISLVSGFINADQGMADENLTCLNRRDHAVIDTPLGSQRQAVK